MPKCTAGSTNNEFQLMSTLSGKVTLITGAKGGLGTSITRAFLEAGAKVVGVSRSIQTADFPHSEFTALPASLSNSAAFGLASYFELQLTPPTNAYPAGSVPGHSTTGQRPALQPPSEPARPLKISPGTATTPHESSVGPFD